MYKRYHFLILGFILIMLTAACGGSTRTRIDAQAAPEVPLDGETLYQSQGCLGCHAVTEDAGYVVGPTMVGMVERAEAIISDPAYTGEATTAEAYIREAILNPNIYITEGYEPIMPATYESTLTPAQIEAIVNYIETLPQQ